MTMRAIRTYATHPEADLDRIELDAAEIPCVVLGVDAAMEGGISGVRLLVPEDDVERALELLERR